MAAIESLSADQFGGLSGPPGLDTERFGPTPSQPAGFAMPADLENHDAVTPPTGDSGRLPDPENANIEGKPQTGGGNESKASPKTWLEKLPKVDHRASSYAGSIYGSIRPGA